MKSSWGVYGLYRDFSAVIRCHISKGGDKVVVGGAPVTQKFAEDIGADGFAYDAPGAAQKCEELLSG